MSLKDRFEKIRSREKKDGPDRDDLTMKQEQQHQLFDIKTNLHRKLIEQLE